MSDITKDNLDHIEDFLRVRFENDLDEQIENILASEREDWEARRHEEIADALREHFEDDLEDEIEHEIEKHDHDRLAAVAGYILARRRRGGDVSMDTFDYLEDQAEAEALTEGNYG